MHSIAVACKSIAAKYGALNGLAHFADKFAAKFSLFVGPVAYVFSAIKSILARNPIDAIFQGSVLPLVATAPLYNIGYGYGLNSGLGITKGPIMEKVGSLDTSSFWKSCWTNTIKIINAYKEFFGDIVSGAKDPNIRRQFVQDVLSWSTKNPAFKWGENLLRLIVGAGMSLSSAAGLLFAHDDLNTPLAKIIGTVRGTCGGIADAILLFLLGEGGEKTTGTLCGGASVLEIAQRFSPEKVADFLQHVRVVLDGMGFTVWANHMANKNLAAAGAH